MTFNYGSKVDLNWLWEIGNSPCQPISFKIFPQITQHRPKGDLGALLGIGLRQFFNLRSVVIHSLKGYQDSTKNGQLPLHYHPATEEVKGKRNFLYDHSILAVQY